MNQCRYIYLYYSEHCIPTIGIRLVHEPPDRSPSRDVTESTPGFRETCEREDGSRVFADSRKKRRTFGRCRPHPRTPYRIRATQEVALLHLGTGRMVAGSGMLRTIPASSRQGRTSCLDETVISSAVSNFAKGPKARTYGSFAIGTEKFHQRHDPR